jgi:integrase
MRPSELLWIRPRDLTEVSPNCWRYDVPPEANKLDHESIDRVVFLGPLALEDLRPWLGLTPAPDQFVFNPRRAEEARYAERRAARVVYPWPSHDPDRRKARRGTGDNYRGDRFSKDAYRRAIQRAIEKHNRLHPEAPVARWFPYQLRHNAATRILEHEDLAVAQAVLGHRDIKTTLRYAKVAEHRAAAAAARHG